MDTNRLRYFCVVAETGSLRRASELLRISPAALSKAIKLLEGEAGFQLLVPEGRGILVTDRGRELAARAKPILEELEGLVENRSLAAARPPALRLGSFEVFTTYFAGILARDHLLSAEIELRELVPGEMEQALVAREIDLAITYIPVPAAGVEHLKVAQLKMEVFARKGAFLSVPFRELPFAIPVLPLKGTPNKVQGLDGWPDDRVFRNVRYRVHLMETAMELCRQGMAVAYLPSFIARLHNEQVLPDRRLDVLPPPRELSSQLQPIYLAKRKSDTEPAMLRRVAKALRMVCKPM